MEAKQKAIQEAYGEHWEAVKDYVDENGWLNTNNWLGGCGNTKVYLKLKGINLECVDSNHSFWCYVFRPKSLQGIENNNGWIKIESEADLPRFTTNCWIVKNGTIINQSIYKDKGFIKDGITHYQPIQKPKPPIY